MAARRKKPDLSHIAEPLRELAVPVDSLTPDPANARTHGKRNLAAIRASLAKFGQRMPIVVQRNGLVVRAGNGRLKAARELGWTHIAALVVDESDVEATAFAIADNRTGELAEWDDSALQAQIRALSELPEFDFEDIGFTDEEIDALLADVAGDSGSGGDSGDGSDDGESLRFRGKTIPLAPEEADLLATRIDDFEDEHGDLHGFARAVLV